MFDQIVTSTFTPIVAFYPNTTTHATSHDKTLDLKNSLSQTLTKYYPFAGRHSKTAPAVVDCNDQGVEFLEASVDSALSDFLQKSQHEDLNQLFPHGLVWYESNYKYHDQSDSVSPLAVQVNRFECGGLAVAVSLSHKVGDGSSLIWFLNDWAKVARSCRYPNRLNHEHSINPHFISFEPTNLNFQGFSIEVPKDCVTRSFTFPNKKLNDLKHKVIAMSVESGQPITDPTRVEVLTWLLYKCAVGSNSCKPAGIGMPTNIRGTMVEPLPENSIGNILAVIEIHTKNESEMQPGFLIRAIKEKKKELRGIKNLQMVFDHLWNKFSKADMEDQQRRIDRDGSYVCSSLCRAPVYEIDFGWGKPIKVTLAGHVGKNSFALMDTPDGDGIEAFVCMKKQDMDRFQSNSELQAFC
ncbi:hypothetical protein QVD17_42099 [Tagetes erecta]|uniref:Uncharacterized protein n=1 Tax=Tagetes erecta TaxID=13708 RepID=A0AAD8JLE7_TARER|nr:hypothetical protein QVD17_42099 [Tagetes erecta]